MKSTATRLLVFTGLALAFAAPAQPQEEIAARHEIGLTLGGHFTTSRQSPGTSLDLGGGVALQANYAYKLIERSSAALYGEVHLLSGPLREVVSADRTVTRDVASLFLTPGVRLKFFPRSTVSPYVAAGGGYALFEHSLNTLDGRPNPAPRTIQRGAFTFGGGVDVRLWRFVGLRAEIRDFYTGSPVYNAVPIRGGQHNVVAGGGFVLRFR